MNTLYIEVNTKHFVSQLQIHTHSPQSWWRRWIDCSTFFICHSLVLEVCEIIVPKSALSYLSPQHICIKPTFWVGMFCIAYSQMIDDQSEPWPTSNIKRRDSFYCLLRGRKAGKRNKYLQMNCTHLLTQNFGLLGLLPLTTYVSTRINSKCNCCIKGLYIG